MRRALAGVGAVAALTLSACGGGGDSDGGSSADDRAREAIAEVTPLEGEQVTAGEEAFVGDLIDNLSRPYWNNTPEVMIRGYGVCASGTPSAEVFNLIDEGYSEADAEAFVDAATEHLC